MDEQRRLRAWHSAFNRAPRNRHLRHDLLPQMGRDSHDSRRRRRAKAAKAAAAQSKSASRTLRRYSDSLAPSRSLTSAIKTLRSTMLAVETSRPEAESADEVLPATERESPNPDAVKDGPPGRQISRSEYSRAKRSAGAPSRRPRRLGARSEAPHPR